MDKVSLELGSGGKLMRDFIENQIKKILGNPFLNGLSDSAHRPRQIATLNVPVAGRRPDQSARKFARSL